MKLTESFYVVENINFLGWTRHLFYNTIALWQKILHVWSFSTLNPSSILKKWIIRPFSTSTILPHFKCHTFLMGWWYSFSLPTRWITNEWGIYYIHLREFWWWYFTYVCMYNIYVKWGEAFSLTHVQHRVIITTLLKWLTFAFDCPKNMNNNIQLPWFNHGELKLFLESVFGERIWRGFHAPSSPWP